MRSFKIFACAGLLVFAAITTFAGETFSASPAAIQQELRSFAMLGSVLYVAAHPDDENTQLITYLARGRGYRTAYLSLTRGDGGQNEIGPEFGEKLGVARTQELLAARRLDGGQQFFTRAIDFGFSKTPEETLRIWDRDQVLSDVVRVIRKFRPDVVITRFPIPPGSGGHGHHTASAILAVEAFKLAGDPKAYPEQLKEGLTPWQPKRILWNGGGAGRAGAGPAGPTVKIDIGGSDPVTGESFAAIAARSRGMHITQGFGNFAGRAGAAAGGPREETFTLLGGEPAEKDFMDGVDTSWGRFPDGAAIGRLADEAIAQFKAADPAASVPALLAIRASLKTISSPAPIQYDYSPQDPVLRDKWRQLTHLLQNCLGIEVQTTMPVAQIVPGELMKLRCSATVHSSVPVKWVNLQVHFPGSGIQYEMRQNQTESFDFTGVVQGLDQLPEETAISQPYWLKEEGSAGIFRVDDPTLIGLAENPPTQPVKYYFSLSQGDTLVVEDEPVQIIAGAPEAQAHQPLIVIPPVSLHFASEVSLFKANESRAVSIDVSAARAGVTGALRIEVPAGWKITPATQPFELRNVDDKARFTFSITAPSQPATGQIAAHAQVKGKQYSSQRIVINYPHLPLMLLQPPARARVASFDFSVRGKNIGYLPGAGDATVEALEQLGYTVTMLRGADLTQDKLQSLDAVVIGVRAFNERKDLAANLPGLFAYAEAGGTVIAQYNRPGNSLPPLAPYSLSIAGPAPQLRVTDENSPVTFLAPDHPALNVPNKITAADFDGWVQERGAYFPSSWDAEHFTPLLAMNDPGEAPLKSSVLIAHHGKGYFVYTGLAFFRQLPAGVPGAYRLFANLVSLGKE